MVDQEGLDSENRISKKEQDALYTALDLYRNLFTHVNPREVLVRLGYTEPQIQTTLPHLQAVLDTGSVAYHSSTSKKPYARMTLYGKDPDYTVDIAVMPHLIALSAIPPEGDPSKGEEDQGSTGVFNEESLLVVNLLLIKGGEPITTDLQIIAHDVAPDDAYEEPLLPPTPDNISGFHKEQNGLIAARWNEDNRDEFRVAVRTPLWGEDYLFRKFDPPIESLSAEGPTQYVPFGRVPVKDLPVPMHLLEE